jgi:hypothetical protein
VQDEDVQVAGKVPQFARVQPRVEVPEGILKRGEYGANAQTGMWASMCADCTVDSGGCQAFLYGQ